MSALASTPLPAASGPPVPSGSAVPSAHKLLEAIEISKRFPGVRALDGVNFDVAHGEIHVLFGENGAGKSTLINVIAGTYPPDGGRLVYDGQELRHLSARRNPKRAISRPNERTNENS
jgi:ribose transport system ATP-binding protein